MSGEGGRVGIRSGARAATGRGEPGLSIIITAAGADTCARAAEAAREGGRGRGRHLASGQGGHAGMWIGEGAGEGGLDAPSKPLGRGCPPPGGGVSLGLDIHALQRYPNNIYFKDVDIYLEISLLKISFEDIDIFLKNQR